MIELLIVAVAIFGYAMVSKRVNMTPLTAPMIFVAVGLALGSSGLGWFNLDVRGATVEVLVEATLVLVLFTDAIRIDLGALRMDIGIPTRLLAIGMPLTIVFGAVAAFWLFDALTWPAAALLAAVLAPTDAALGKAAVDDSRLPVRIRQSLNTESGLNDGIALPVVTVLIGLVAVEAAESPVGLVEFIARQLGFGLLGGVAAGYVGGRLLHVMSHKRWVGGAYRQLATLAVAAAAFAAAELFDGNGFIAAFVAGLAFGRVAHDECEGVEDFTEDEGILLMGITFVVFGAVIAGPLLAESTWTIWLYAALSLTLIRMIPVIVSMTGSHTYFETRLFLGWFGPRGLASILFALVVLKELGTAQSELIAIASVATVTASVYAHGLTASPWASRLGQKLASGPEDMPEMMPMEEMPIRWRAF